ncbi:2-succinyl-5-enolpyruvyl-6-hydroxy-3-cyclohexene-1-carboxylic-acid synthase [Leptolyngbya sp. O-77]|uniref:2-succinyl-5-enolpyruvyl-6-hydroxy-3- cyclohexene-1-carboxylic-acid synthase n=1 Tax=Leptolyngbya sp. O-77 TaxID=1080068 RepID=UPI0029391184|nr:2-succinyl-5-enolpyruvyl-6-hydroxy-3-cyclohexene-1-carboxylic-acid synthase [Leptolyngbya sp. O-77]
MLTETLVRLGLQVAVVCPGSRSAPLAIALSQQSGLEAIPVLDERSAAFFALGLAKQTRRPTALVCTSGTAGANFFPAVIEARESRVPLLVLTADRPPELRDCNAGQTVDQQKLFGSFVNWYHEVATPTADAAQLAYLRQTAIHAWERTQHPVAGAVHLNLPFRDPLAPVPQPDVMALRASVDEARFFANVFANVGQADGVPEQWRDSDLTQLLLSLSPRGLIIAGIAQFSSATAAQAHCRAIARLSHSLGFPVLAEGLSPLRNYARLNPYLVSSYDTLLRDPDLATELAPEGVLRIGEMPTSKELRSWLERTQPQQWVVDEGDRNLDPLHLRTVHLRSSVQQLAASLPSPPAPPTDYLKRWLQAETDCWQQQRESLRSLDSLIEAKTAWVLSQCLPPETPLVIANSTVVRYVEWFWEPGDRAIQPFCNRGANGIDGTLSTALGIAHGNQPSVLLTGDLALLHDTNGFLLRPRLRGHLTIVLINNRGGGIFENLPIAQFEPPFEEFFATPQSVDFAALCATYGIAHELVHTWEQLAQALKVLPSEGIRVLELQCDRKLNARWLAQRTPR